MAKETPETRVKNMFKQRVQIALTDRGLTHKLTYNAGAAFGVATLDCTGTICGWSVAFEFKRFDGKGKLTARQKLDLQEYAAAGAITMVIDSEAKLDKVTEWFWSLPDYRALMRPPLHWTM